MAKPVFISWFQGKPYYSSQWMVRPDDLPLNKKIQLCIFDPVDPDRPFAFNTFQVDKYEADSWSDIHSSDVPTDFKAFLLISGYSV